LVSIGPGEVGSHAAARRGHVDLMVVLLQPADPHSMPAGDELQVVAHTDRTVDQCAGDHCAEAAHREDAIDWEARPAEVGASLGVVEDAIEGCRELVEALA